MALFCRSDLHVPVCMWRLGQISLRNYMNDLWLAKVVMRMRTLSLESFCLRGKTEQVLVCPVTTNSKNEPM